ncbi:MFS transporter [Streptomyces polyrhachis]|uniref:MFS transporter n=1 Tax=Streptomyces polyrhachis TaxID=1282885 RepID=A0ABW2GH86_9ACTN
MSTQPGRDRRPLAALLTAGVVSATGSSMSLIAVPWFVFDTTGSAAKTGLVAFCEGVPMVLAALLGGPLIDRTGRRRMSVLCDTVSAAAIGLIPLLHYTGVLSFWMICATVAVMGLCGSPGETARGVLVPHLSERAGITVAKGAGYYESARQLARLLGAPLAGVLIAFLDAPSVLVLDAVSFLVAALLIGAGLRTLAVAAPVRDAPAFNARVYRAELREGFAFLRRTRLLLGIVLMVMATNALNNGWAVVLLPLHARQDLGGSVDLGIISGIAAAGSVAGALLYGRVAHRFPRWPVYTAAFLVCGAPRFVLAALVPELAPLAVMMAFSGFAAGTLNPVLGPVIYETVPEELRSRVGSVTTAGVLSAIPIGVLGSGLLTGAAGLDTALWVLGGIYLAVTACPLVFPVWRTMDRRPPADAQVRKERVAAS